MVHPDQKKLEDLIKKVEQHEQTIAQLVVIIAETNRRMTEIASHTEDVNQQHFLTT